MYITIFTYTHTCRCIYIYIYTHTTCLLILRPIVYDLYTISPTVSELLGPKRSDFNLPKLCLTKTGRFGRAFFGESSVTKNKYSYDDHMFTYYPKVH